MIVIETQRLQLREMTPADRPALCRILQDSEVMYAYNGPFSDEEVDEWLERQLARYRQYGYGLWAVVLKATGEMIGQCGLTLQQWNGREMLEVGYLFQRSYWHQGYATEAARACMDYAFGTLNSPIVCSIIRDNNLPSKQVALRNGMTRKAGVMVKHYRGAEMPHWLFIKPRTIRTVRYQSPCGEMLLGAAGDRLCLCNWAKELHPGRVEQRLRTLLKAQFEDCGQILPEVLRQTVRELDEYFRGERKDFDIPLLLAGSDFQKRVWQQLRHIPYTLRTDRILRRAGRSHRCPEIRPGSGQCQRCQRHLHHPPLPPRHRKRRQPHRLRWRPQGQAVSSRPGMYRMYAHRANTTTSYIPDKYPSGLMDFGWPQALEIHRHQRQDTY